MKLRHLYPQATEYSSPLMRLGFTGPKGARSIEIEKKKTFEDIEQNQIAPVGPFTETARPTIFPQSILDLYSGQGSFWN